MNDRRFFQAPIQQFVYPNPKQKCLQYLAKQGIQQIILTYNCKKYLTGGLLPLIKHMSSFSANKRCFFEVIPPNTPTKLYFDFDYSGTIDEEKFKKFEEVFIEVVNNRLQHDHFYRDYNGMDPLVLKSNGNAKFSIHYIFPVVFENTALMKEFVLNVVSDLSTTPYGGYIDTGVYTAWRNFRLIGNTKANKMNHLQLINATTNCDTDAKRLLTCFVSVMRNKETYSQHHKDLCFLFECKKILKRTEHTEKISLNRGTKTLCQSTIPDKYKDQVKKIEQEIIQKKYPNYSYYRSFQKFNEQEFVDYVFYPGLPCPYNNDRSHKSNRTYFKINLSANKVFFRCADPECSKEPFGRQNFHEVGSNKTAIPEKKTLSCEHDSSAYRSTSDIKRRKKNLKMG